MQRTLFLDSVLIATFASSMWAAERPNILFLLSDDHAQEAIGAYGSWLKDYVQTPMIVPRLLILLLFITNSAFPVEPIKLRTGRVLLLIDADPTYNASEPG